MYNYLQPLIKHSGVRRYAAGTIILHQGEVPQFANVLAKGVVRVFSISEQGDEQIVAFHVAGEFFPSSWIFNKAPCALFFYETLTECEIAFCERQELLTFMRETPERTEALINYFTTSYTASLIRINALAQPKARDKLAYTLYFLCQRYARDNTAKITIPISLTHQNFASLVGLTRETVAIEMNKLKQERIIEYRQKFYTIDRDRLFSFLGEESFQGLEIKEPDQ